MMSNSMWHSSHPRLFNNWLLSVSHHPCTTITGIANNFVNVDMHQSTNLREPVSITDVIQSHPWILLTECKPFENRMKRRKCITWYILNAINVKFTRDWHLLNSVITYLICFYFLTFDFETILSQHFNKESNFISRSIQILPRYRPASVVHR